MKIFSFDIGISSIGWAVVENCDDKFEINDSGIRIFTKAEDSQTGKSLALPRREARGVRRLNRRRRQRVFKIKSYFSKLTNVALNEISQEFGELSPLFQTDKNTLSPWQLRSEALKRKLDKKEWLRVLIHIAKHRGYNDILSDKGEDKNDGEILKALQENRTLLKTKNYQTIGEMMFEEYFEVKQEDGNFINLRNKAKKIKKSDGKEKFQSTPTYFRSIPRSLNLEETKLLFQKQRELGNEFATKEAEKFYIQEAFFQRKLKSFDNLVGECKYIKGEKRAAKNSISAEKFVALTKIINLLEYFKNSTGLVFDKKVMIDKIFKELENTRTFKISYENLREVLELDKKICFKDVDYLEKIKQKPVDEGKIEVDKKKAKKSPESKVFLELKSYKALSDILGDLRKFQVEILDEICTKITLIKDIEDLKTALKSILFPLNLQNLDEILDKLSKLSFSKHIDLSSKALYKILPFMQDGKRYDEALMDADLKLIRAEARGEFLPPFNDTLYANSLTNPVVARAISEYRKVLNALVKKYGSPHKIHLELTRETGRNYDDRRKIANEQKINEQENEQARKACADYKLKDSGANLLKLKLYLRQKKICVYSGREIDSSYLHDEEALEIDHIYPFSRSFDDSQANKVLVFTEQNRGKINSKNNRTPFEWFGDDKQRWDKFIKTINSTNLSKSTRKRLINPNFKDRKLGEQGGFLERNLRDTSYMATLIKDYTQDYLKFQPITEDENEYGKGSKQHIVCINGSLTAMLRHFWGLDSKDRSSYLHHAEDAMILGLITNSNVKAYADYKTNLLEYKAKKAKDEAWDIKKCDDFKTKALLKGKTENFKAIVEQKLEKIFVSVAPRRKVGGALHLETIYKKEEFFKAYGGEEGVEKAVKLGKIRQIRGGYVNNGAMSRVDIFRHNINGKFYAVPIYTYDFALGILPNKAIISGKDNGIIKDWLEMDEDYRFCFSLFKNDLVQIQTGKMKNPLYCYYIGADTANNSLEFFKHNKTKPNTNDERLFFKDSFKNSAGIPGVVTIKKCEVSPLGEIKEFEYKPREQISLKTTKRAESGGI